MSTAPPPPPFGYSPGPNTGPGYDRRTLKAQRRAAAQQAQFQRAQFREQIRAARRGSVLGPILLVSIGIVLLLLETDRLHWPAVFLWLGRWWPGILIGAGLVMLAEWAIDRKRVSPAGVSLAPRRVLGGGATALLILLALLGAGSMAVQNSSAWARHNLNSNYAGRDFGDWRKVFGSRSESTRQMQTPLAADGSLTVDDPRGDITVTGSSQDGQVHVTVHQHIFAWQTDGAQERRRNDDVRFSGDRTHVVLTASPQDEDDTDLTIELPHEAPLTIHSNRGDISIEELRGAVNVTARNGDVKLTALRGPVHLSTQDDNADITAHSLAGGFTLDGRTGDITLSDVDGAVTLHGDFFGTTHLERIRGPVHFQSSFTDFLCVGIPGDMNVEGRSDFNAHRLQGPVTLSTTNRNLTLEGVRGGATITNRNGSVTLALVGPLQPTHISNQDGSIEVSVPSDQAFAVKAQTSNGEIQNDFGFATKQLGEGSEFVGTTRGGGPSLVLSTTEGDLHLRRTSTGELSDWNDDHLRITPTPTKPQPAKKNSKPSSPASESQSAKADEPI
ncbi:MAG: DUF4097 family beta strand repeat-containing protein [Janthinobacterium lividum]